MHSNTIRYTELGDVVISSELIKSFRIKPGTPFEVLGDENFIILKRKQNESKLFQELKKGYNDFSKFNSKLAEENIIADNEALNQTLETLNGEEDDYQTW